uniref:exodeoxyribonuclease III n=1 Tax=Pseudonaja textilis TaxID=8673 RepID=A0A670Y452_PSETE
MIIVYLLIIENQGFYLSININGLNSRAKRKRILTKLIKQNVDIICIQETHIRKSEEKFLDCPKLGKLFTAPADKKKKKGIAIYVRDDLKAELIWADPVGRTLVVQISINGITLLLVVIYAPNDDQGKFFKHLHQKITEFENGNIILIGDFNSIADYRKDHSNRSKNKKGNREFSKPYAPQHEPQVLEVSIHRRYLLPHVVVMQGNPEVLAKN